MSSTSQKARDAAKAKAERMVRSGKQRVDASDFSAQDAMDANAPTGMLPISRRAFRGGGSVQGCAPAPRADRKPRASGGALTAVSLMNRNQKEANEARPGIHFRGGYKGGGAINDGTRPVAGRLARKGGGRAKKGTNINIIIAPQGGGGAKPPMPPMGAPPPGGMPPGLHQGAPPPPPPAAMGPGAPAPAGMPMGRKTGGRTLEKGGGKLVKPGKYPIDSGAGGGLGRLEKAKRA
jgi:hypothetical protein